MEKIIHLSDVLYAAGWLMPLRVAGALRRHRSRLQILRGTNTYIQRHANICCLPHCEHLCKSVATTADVHGRGAQTHMRTCERVF